MKISQLEPYVEEALQKNPSARKDNFILYVEVLKNFVDINMSFASLCLNHKILSIPSLESITRCRRKLQENNPSLRDEETDNIRQKEEIKHYNYARGYEE